MGPIGIKATENFIKHLKSDSHFAGDVWSPANKNTKV